MVGSYFITWLLYKLLLKPCAAKLWKCFLQSMDSGWDETPIWKLCKCSHFPSVLFTDISQAPSPVLVLGNYSVNYWWINKWLGLSCLDPAVHMEACDRRGQKRAVWAVNGAGCQSRDGKARAIWRDWPKQDKTTEITSEVKTGLEAECEQKSGIRAWRPSWCSSVCRSSWKNHRMNEAVAFRVCGLSKVAHGIEELYPISFNMLPIKLRECEICPFIFLNNLLWTFLI